MDEGYFQAANRKQMEAIGNLFGAPPPPSQPPPAATQAIKSAATAGGASGGGGGGGVQVAPQPAACGKSEPGCVESDLARSRAARSGYMVPWSFSPSKPAASAAAELQRELKALGARAVDVADGAGYVRVSAAFDAGPLGTALIVDRVEFLLSDGGGVAFRAAASTGGFPFSTAGQAVERNRARLLRARASLFGKSGWGCGCPDVPNPLGAAKCALTCS